MFESTKFKFSNINGSYLMFNEFLNWNGQKINHLGVLNFCSLVEKPKKLNTFLIDKLSEALVNS